MTAGFYSRLWLWQAVNRDEKCYSVTREKEANDYPQGKKARVRSACAHEMTPTQQVFWNKHIYIAKILRSQVISNWQGIHFSDIATFAILSIRGIYLIWFISRYISVSESIICSYYGLHGSFFRSSIIVGPQRPTVLFLDGNAFVSNYTKGWVCVCHLISFGRRSIRGNKGLHIL